MERFLGLLNQAVDIVTTAYPGSLFLQADGTPMSNSAASESEVTTWRFVFMGPEQHHRQTSVFLEYQADVFGSPALVNEPFVGDFVIDLPVEMGLRLAIDLKEAAGYGGPFQVVRLRWPLSPTNKEPFYIFLDATSGHYLFVGTETGKVTSLDATGSDRSIATAGSTITIPGASFIPDSSANWLFLDGTVQGGGSAHAPLLLPPGVTMTEIIAHASNTFRGKTITLTLNRFPRDGSALASEELARLVFPESDTVQDLSTRNISVPVYDESYLYHFGVDFDDASGIFLIEVTIGYI